MRLSPKRSYKLVAFLLAATGSLAAPAWAAPDVALEVVHRSSSIGADGIQRDTLMTERIVRLGNTVWVERVMPAGFVHSDEGHKAGKVSSEHKHADLSSAARWIERQEGGKLRFRMVAMHDKVVVDVAPNEFATVGFDGKWDAAYYLIDPALLKKLQAGAVESGAQWFENVKPGLDNKVRILWSAKNEIPLKVISQSRMATRTTTVRVLNTSPSKPWQATNKFASKDYSDFLD
jgi:hypothetical protein